MFVTYQMALKDYHKKLKEGWDSRAAMNDAITSYPLTLKEQAKLWKIVPKDWKGAM